MVYKIKRVVACRPFWLFYQCILTYIARYHRLRGKPIILISGTARTGSTALFEFFSEHPDILAFNESRILFAIYQFLAKARFIDELSKNMVALQDKMRELYYDYRVVIRYNNLRNKIIVETEVFDIIGMPDFEYESCIVELLRAFPNMKVIYLMRDPDRVINSMLNRKWGYSINKALGIAPRDYSVDESIKIWNTAALTGKAIIQNSEFEGRIMLLKIEDLDQDPKRYSKMLQEFAGIKSDLCFSPQPTREMNLDGKTLNEIKERTREGRLFWDYK